MAGKKTILKKEQNRPEVRLPSELEEPIVGIALSDEKLEDTELASSAGEEADEESPLDSEDLNPFGDSWEE